MKSRQNKINYLKVFIECALSPNSEIINVATTVWDTPEHVIHESLRYIWRDLDTHRKAVVGVVVFFCGDYTNSFAPVRKFKAVKHH